MGTNDDENVPSPPTTEIDVAIKVEEEDNDDGQSRIRNMSEQYCSVDDDGDDPVAIKVEEEDSDDGQSLIRDISEHHSFVDDDVDDAVAINIEEEDNNNNDDDDEQSLIRNISEHYFSINDGDGDDKEDDEQAINYSKSLKVTENDVMMKETTSRITDKDSLLIRKKNSNTKTKYVHIDDDNNDTNTTKSNNSSSSSSSRNADNGVDDIEEGIRTELDDSLKSYPGAYAITHPDFHTNAATDALSKTSTTMPTSVNADLSLSTVSTLTTNQIQIETRQQRQQQQQQEPKLIEAEVVVDPTVAFEIINYENKKKMVRRKKNILNLAVVITLAIVCSVSAVLVHKAKASEQSSPRCEYDCIMNTTELARIQYQDFKDSNFTTTKDRYILCPNTTSNIAIIRSQAFENAPTNLIDGTFPIIFVQPNTIIQCGLDDDKDAGSCVISGGRYQLTLLGTREYEEQFIPYLFPDYTKDDLDLYFHGLPNNFIDNSLDNITVRGLTFTGDLGGINGASGGSVIINIPSNLTLDHCHWRDINVYASVIYLTTDALFPGSSPYPQLSGQITLRNCQFDSIQYNYALINVEDNIIVIENTTFKDIEVGITSYDISEYCPGFYASSGVPISINEQQNYMNQSDKCDYVIGCGRSSRCEITQFCKADVESSGTQWLLKAPKATVAIDEQSNECGFNYDMPATTQE